MVCTRDGERGAAGHEMRRYAAQRGGLVVAAAARLTGIMVFGIGPCVCLVERRCFVEDRRSVGALRRSPGPPESYDIHAAN